MLKKQGKYKGYNYYIVFHDIGELPTSKWYCGYVELPKSHPWYGMFYDDIYEEWDVEVHGGLTFSGHLDSVGEDHYLIGFDCAHEFDNYHVQNEEYVENECKGLIEQVIKGENKHDK